MVKINIKGKEIEIEPVVAYDGLDGIRDTFAMDCLYGGSPIGLEEALSSVRLALERLIAITDTLSQKRTQPPEEVLSELNEYQGFSATYRKEYEWWGVEPGPPKEVVYELGDIVRKKATEILISLEEPHG